ncbi:tetratricopeptide repeat protein [Actinokineospora auranticolor]|uniref:tetratricopeptide repeat protein n=1 Tax=Actinokineospora auranticolor TaxID=155976 RepID=UPI000CEBE072|nr:tetratricopeptide repeat protein [Actinokineospora auranticolor]
MSLINLGVNATKAGEKTAALAPTREGVELYRELVEADPVKRLPGFASGLNNLGSRLSLAGEQWEALSFLREAVDIRRALVEVDPIAYRAELATTLSNASSQFALVGEVPAALAFAHEAVEILRGHARADPVAYLPAFARCLWRLACVQSAHGMLERADARREVLAAMDESCGIYRSLAAEWPGIYAEEYEVMAKARESLVGGD